MSDEEEFTDDEYIDIAPDEEDSGDDDIVADYVPLEEQQQEDGVEGLASLAG